MQVQKNQVVSYIRIKSSKRGIWSSICICGKSLSRKKFHTFFAHLHSHNSSNENSEGKNVTWLGFFLACYCRELSVRVASFNSLILSNITWRYSKLNLVFEWCSNEKIGSLCEGLLFIFKIV